jgi:hypothetical protein
MSLLSYPELVRILREEFADKAPFSDETHAAMEARLKELQPTRNLFVLTTSNNAISGVGEGKL